VGGVRADVLRLCVERDKRCACVCAWSVCGLVSGAFVLREAVLEDVLLLLVEIPPEDVLLLLVGIPPHTLELVKCFLLNNWRLHVPSDTHNDLVGLSVPGVGYR
jgi:hypothetical protein